VRGSWRGTRPGESSGSPSRRGAVRVLNKAGRGGRRWGGEGRLVGSEIFTWGEAGREGGGGGGEEDDDDPAGRGG
jgi:hypothetical protein